MTGIVRAICGETLDILYAGQPFNEAMTALAEVARRDFGTDAMMQFQIFNPRSQEIDAYFVSARATDAMKADYLEHYLGQDARVPEIAARPGRSIACHHLVDETAHERSALVNEFLDRPDVNARFCMASFDPLTPDAAVLTAVLRPRREGCFEPDDVRRLDALRPHLLTQIRLQRQLAGLRGPVLDMADAFHIAPEAMLIADRNLHIYAVNAAAEAILGSAGPIAIRAAVLHVDGPTAPVLAAAVRAAADLREGFGQSQAVPVLLTDPAGRATLAIGVYPLPRLDPHRLSARRGEVILVLRPLTTAPAHRRLGALRQMGLSPAEAAVAGMLADGLTPGEIAQARGAGLETIRSQIKSALAKTGSRRQSDLVRLVLAVA